MLFKAYFPRKLAKGMPFVANSVAVQPQHIGSMKSLD
jgi:hypothetical protein